MGFWGGSGITWTICKQSTSRSRQITTPTPHHSIFTGWMLFLTPSQQCQSTEGNNLHTKSRIVLGYNINKLTYLLTANLHILVIMLSASTVESSKAVSGLVSFHLSVSVCQYTQNDSPDGSTTMRPAVPLHSSKESFPVLVYVCDCA